VYERFGRRLAADAYRVRALDDATRDPDGTFDRVAKVLTDEASPGPRVLIGVDTGALYAVALAAQGLPGLDALVLAGLPGVDAPGPDVDWAGELDLRTACPTHRGRLEADGSFQRGALAVPPDLLSSPALDQLAVPVLALHGADDTVAPLSEARRTYSGFPDIQLVSLAGTRHDVLNDVTHRTAAATLVLFLERLRLSPGLPVIAAAEGVREEPSA
jgi:alpha-beta hydrolase superfamily lysophospholipase